jgi:hypothetical protein
MAEGVVAAREHDTVMGSGGAARTAWRTAWRSKRPAQRPSSATSEALERTGVGGDGARSHLATPAAEGNHRSRHAKSRNCSSGKRRPCHQRHRTVRVGDEKSEMRGCNTLCFASC